MRTLPHGPCGTQIKRCSPAAIIMAVSTRGRSAGPAGLTYLLFLQSKWSLWTKALSSRTDRTFPFPRSRPMAPGVCFQNAPESSPMAGPVPQSNKAFWREHRDSQPLGKAFWIFKGMRLVYKRSRYSFPNNQLVRVRRKLIELLSREMGGDFLPEIKPGDHSQLFNGRCFWKHIGGNILTMR